MGLGSGIQGQKATDPDPQHCLIRIKGSPNTDKDPDP